MLEPVSKIPAQVRVLGKSKAGSLFLVDLSDLKVTGPEPYRFALKN
jgi:hypothetical protein